MTIREMYEWAKANNVVDAEIEFDYHCDDDWYDFNGSFSMEDTFITKDGKFCIEIFA